MNSWFTRNLMSWNFRENKRSMPWKGEKDPYKIWLSEIILQQTRVEQGLSYYERFIDSFPTIADLANAPVPEVFKMWEGLGYYSRCRNMMKAADSVMRDRKGIFPDNYDDILRLPGIGPYTAAAISSFAYNQPFAVVDGNVYRVLARVFGIDIPTDTDAGKKHFNKLAAELLDKKEPGKYNQAIMDFGATVCKPKNPACPTCPFNNKCIAFIKSETELYPVKSKKLLRRSRYFYYFLVEYNDQILVRERITKDIWQHLNEFVLLERDEELSQENIAGFFPAIGIQKKSIKDLRYSAKYTQQLTHQQICGFFTQITLKEAMSPLPGYLWMPKSNLEKLAFPRYILSYLKEKK